MTPSSRSPASPYRSYTIGLLLSLMFTYLTYYVVTQKLVTGSDLTKVVLTLGVLQAITQLFLFLHLGNEEKPHWKMISFLFMAMVLIIIVFGSMWIMANLNYNVMPHNASSL